MDRILLFRPNPVTDFCIRPLSSRARKRPKARVMRLTTMKRKTDLGYWCFKSLWTFYVAVAMLNGLFQCSTATEGILRVTGVLVEPYLISTNVVSLANDTSGHQRAFIGYLADLIHRLSQVATFDYVIQPVEDGSFGFQQADGSWDGIIGELISGVADIAAAPIYVTSQRSKVVGFTDPYMSVYATVLVRKSFEASQPSMRSLKDLLALSAHGQLSIGTLNRGVLVRAFKRTNVSLYRMVWKQMQRSRPSVFTKSNEEGVARIRSHEGRDLSSASSSPLSSYAFILPSPIGEYISLQQPCDLNTVGKFLIQKGYCLAVARGNGALRQRLNTGLRMLQETGFLDALYRKWWQERNECNAAEFFRSQKSYSVRNVAVHDMQPSQGFGLSQKLSLLNIILTVLLAMADL